MNINNINSGNVPRIAHEFAKTVKNSKRDKVTRSGAMSVGKPFASLIRKAIEEQDVSASAIHKAKNLLQAGQLDTQENIRQAAERILSFGF